jgi:hypothetical protein
MSLFEKDTREDSISLIIGTEIRFEEIIPFPAGAGAGAEEGLWVEK